MEVDWSQGLVDAQSGFQSYCVALLFENVAAPPSTVPICCTNECALANDEVCDDGGDLSYYDFCTHGTDCADCGVRCTMDPPSPPSPPAAPSPPSLPPSSASTPLPEDLTYTCGYQKALLSLGNASFSDAESFVMAVYGCNRAGACSHSDVVRVQVVSEYPQAGSVALHGGANGLSELGFLEPTASSLIMSWSGWTLGTGATGTLSYEVCTGTTPHGCQVASFVPVDNSGAWMSGTLPLTCGSTYYVAVRATSCAGLRTEASSSAMKLCCDGPSAGTLELIDATGGTEVAYVGGSNATVTARWSGFSDACAGIRAYSISMSDGATLLWSSGNLTSNASEVTLPSAYVDSLAHGKTITVTLNATNQAQLSSSVSASLLVDRTPPVIESVFTGETALTHVSCQSTGAPFYLTWVGGDDESGVASIEWAIGTALYENNIKPYGTISDGAEGSVPRRWNSSDAGIDLAVDQVVYYRLRVTNGAGDTSVTLSPPVRMVAYGCGVSRTCLPPFTSNLNAPSAVFPLFLPLVFSWPAVLSKERKPPGRLRLPSTADAEVAPAPMHYDVEAIVHIPKKPPMGGRMVFRARVQLHSIERHSNGSRLMAICIERDSLLDDGAGMSHPILGHKRKKHPFFFLQEADGTIAHVFHHPKETEESLSSKRLLVSYLQLPRSSPNVTASPMSRLGRRAQTKDAPASAQQWHASERDAYGEADVIYLRRQGLFGRKILRKQLHWRPGSGRPEGLTQMSNVSAVIDQHSDAPLRIESAMSLHFEQLPHEQQIKGTIKRGGGTGLSSKQLDYLPKAPTRVSFSYVPRSTLKRRQLSTSPTPPRLDASLFRRAPLEHVPAPPSEAEIASRRGRHKNGRAVHKTAEDEEVPCSEVLGRAKQLVGCAAVYVSPPVRSSQKQKRPCVHELHMLSHSCPSIPTVPLIEEALLAPRCVETGACVGLINALDLIASAEPERKNRSEAALARFVRAAGTARIHGAEIGIAVSRFHPPSEALLQALHDITVQAGHTLAVGPMLLAAADAAGRAAPNSFAAARIEQHVLGYLEHAKGADAARWERVHDDVRRSSEKQWRKMHAEEREHWVRHHTHLNRKAFEWELAAGRYVEHEEHARAMLERSHRLRHPDYDNELEILSMHGVVLGLRALQNLNHSRHADAICRCFGHRSEMVLDAAAQALAASESEVAETGLLSMLARQYDGGATAHRKSPKLTLRALRSLLAWKGVSTRTIVEVVRHLLEKPLYLEGLVGHERAHTSCVKRCKRHCNPHGGKANCHQRCKERCKHDIEARGLLRTLVREGMARSSDAISHVRSAVDAHAPNAHPSHHKWHQWLIKSGHYSKRGANSSLLMADASVLNGSAANDSAHGRSLQLIWDKIDFNSFSLTFVVINLAHIPITFDQFWGERNLFDGKGAGLYMNANVENSLQTTIGLFGGSFGLSLDNTAKAGVELIILNVDIFRAALQFKIDITYIPPIPASLLSSAQNLLDAGAGFIAAAESIKAVVTRVVQAMIDKTCYLMGRVDAFIESLPTTWINGLLDSINVFFDTYGTMLFSTVTTLDQGGELAESLTVFEPYDAALATFSAHGNTFISTLMTAGTNEEEDIIATSMAIAVAMICTVTTYAWQARIAKAQPATTLPLA